MAQNPKNKKKKTNLGAFKEVQSSSLINSKSKAQSQVGIPKPVANRMARRIAFTTGLPTTSGMGVFIGSYILISKGVLDIPPALTLVTSAALFLLGLLGLSYGILSASWDKEPGTILGFENIRPNIARMRASFKANNDKKESEI